MTTSIAYSLSDKSRLAEQATVTWQTPVTLEPDVDADEDEQIAQDNLSITVEAGGYTFETCRRFTILIDEHGTVQLYADPEWPWDAYNELSTEEQHILACIDDHCPQKLECPQDVREQLRVLL